MELRAVDLETDIWRLVKSDDGSMAEPDIELFHSAHSAVCEYTWEECYGLSADY